MRSETQDLLLDSYGSELSVLYERLVGATDSIDRDSFQMNLTAYLTGFGETKSGLIPNILQPKDL